MKSYVTSNAVGTAIFVATVLCGEGINRMHLPGDNSVPLALISYASRILDVASNIAPGFAAAIFLGRGNFRQGAFVGIAGTIVCYGIFALGFKVDLGPYFAMNVILTGGIAAVSNGVGAMGANSLLNARHATIGENGIESKN